MVTTGVQVLQRLLGIEHGVVWAYGVLGARLAQPLQDAARQAEDAHRARRDALRAQVRRRGGTPVTAAAAYRLPFPVIDSPSALHLAVVLENDVATGYDRALGGTDDVELRKLAVAALQEAAVRAARWRLAAGPGTSPTVALPGFSSG